MAIIRIQPHLEDNSSTVDIQFTDNPYGTWTALATDEAVANFPKKYSDSRITTDTYIKFRIKNTSAEYSEWSDYKKALVTNKPEPHKDLCLVYGRIRNPNTAEYLNEGNIRFQKSSGTVSVAGCPEVKDITIELDNYGWFGAYLTPGIIYTATCLEGSIKKTMLTVPTAKNAKFSVL